MREIKFRAWDKKREEMLHYEGIFNTPDIRFDTSILMQYTGLHDEKGKEIYEGDILRDEQGEGFVVWCEGDAMWGVEKNEDWVYPFSCNVYRNTHEIIGNIYENKDLLNN